MKTRPALSRYAGTKNEAARIRGIASAVFVVAGWLVASDAVRAQTYSVIGSFGGGVIHPSRLVQGSDGSLYGTTESSFGSGNKGAIFKMATDGTLTTLHVFSGGDGWEPGGLIQAADGNLYGTTAAGGASNNGTIFKIDTNGTTLTTLRNFVYSEGAGPAGLIQAADGYLYGTTTFTLFKIDTNGTTLTTLHTFTEGGPGGLIQGTDANLYGTTTCVCVSTNGTVFKIATDGTSFTTLHDFAHGSDGGPSGVIQAADGNLYGTTRYSGTGGFGTIFRVDTNGTTFTTLHVFSGSDGKQPSGGVTQAADGNLYGTASEGGASDYGTIFKIATDGTSFTTLHDFANGPDGQWPFVGLIQAADGYLYGTTSEGDGGPSYAGTIFRIDTNGTTLTTLHYFFWGGDGAYPYAGLIQAADGDLYGAAYGWLAFSGGPGTIFKIATNGPTPIALHHFSHSDGALPAAGLIQPADGYLYGTTQSDGTNGYGTIFKMATDGTLTTLYAFSGSDGAYPWAGLIQAADGDLYGTTSSGGVSPGYGTIFKIATDGTSFTTLHSFVNSDGAIPLAGLIQGADGNLCGTTSSGGTSGYGTIFKIDTSGTTLTTLHAFSGSDGANPYAGLFRAADGKLYGTTALGGASGKGTVFKIAADGTSFTTVHSFVNSDGIHPYAGLIQAADGNLYGTTFEGGASGSGTIFRIATNGTSFSTLHNFVYSEGANPYAGLLQAADGNLYGTATVGGSNGGGVVFKLAPCVLSQSPVVTAVHCVAPDTAGLAASVSGNSADAYHWAVFGGTIAGGQGTQNITFTSGAAGTRLSVQVFETDSNGCVGAAAEIVQVDFNDVPWADPFQPYVCIIGREGITAGYGNGYYGRNDPVTRAQMAVFLLTASQGPYTPPACTGVFGDVPCAPEKAFAVDWIEELYHEGISGGCGSNPLVYCPDSPVTRAQMAVLLLVAEHGVGWAPPACTGVFADVPCAPVKAFAVDWIEQLYAEGVTGGCDINPLKYCPDEPVTRGQMAVFLVVAFGL